MVIGKIGPNGEIYQATIKSNPDFDAGADADALRNAMKGLGTNEKVIIEIFGSRTHEEIIEIQSTYKSTFGRDLLDDLKSELSGKFEKVITYIFLTMPELFALYLYNAIKGAGTNETILAYILGVCTNQEIRAICKAYKELLEKKGITNRDLESDICDDVSGTFQKVLVALLQGDRDEPTDKDMENFKKIGIKALVKIDLAEQQAKELYEAGEDKIGTDESTFIKILCKSSVWQIAAIDKFYAELSSKSLVEAISSELSGDLRTIMTIMVKACLDRPAAYAELLHIAMKGAGTNDDLLILIIVARREIDLGSIKEAFHKNYDEHLSAAVISETSGDYKRILLKLIGEN